MPELEISEGEKTKEILDGVVVEKKPAKVEIETATRDAQEKVNDVAAVKEDIKEIIDDTQAGEQEKAEASGDVVVRKYSDEEILTAIGELEKEGYIGRLLSAMRKGQKPQAYEVSQEDIDAVIAAANARDGDAFVSALQEIARKGSEYPAIEIVSGFVKADNERAGKRKLAKLLKGVELQGDIGYELGDDDDIGWIDSDEFKNSKYGKVICDLAKSGITNLDQLEFIRDKLTAMLNEGLTPKEAIEKAEKAKSEGVIKGATAITATPGSPNRESGKSVTEMSGEELKQLGKDLLSRKDYAGYEKVKRQLFGESE
jgi:hypothetical protein